MIMNIYKKNNNNDKIDNTNSSFKEYMCNRVRDLNVKGESP